MSFTKRKKLYKTFFAISIMLLFIVIAISANIGSTKISIADTVLIILSKIPLINHFVPIEQLNGTSVIIILGLRLPRIILAALVGAGLSVVGTCFQGIFKNPMADPYILGISSGAALGATIAVIFGVEATIFGLSFITMAAFVFSIVTTIIVYNIARIGSKVPIITLLLSGIAISSFLYSIISLFMTFKRNDMVKIVMWTMGGLNTSNWDQIKVVTPIIIITTLLLFFMAKDLNIMFLGEENATHLGVNVEQLKKIVLVLGTLMVSAVVSVSGIIGFIGLIIPHAVRMMFGSDNRVVIPFSALFGAIFLILCDTIARTIVSPTEIPLGIVTSVLGVPFFIYLLHRSKKKVL